MHLLRQIIFGINLFDYNICKLQNNIKRQKKGKNCENMSSLKLCSTQQNTHCNHQTPHRCITAQPLDTTLHACLFIAWHIKTLKYGIRIIQTSATSYLNPLLHSDMYDLSCFKHQRVCLTNQFEILMLCHKTVSLQITKLVSNVGTMPLEVKPFEDFGLALH